MTRSTAPLQDLLRALDKSDAYVILRNHDVAAHIERGGDVDLLVADRDRTQRQLIAELGDPLSIARRSYVTSLFFEWVDVDLVSSLEWRGAKYLKESRLLEEREQSPWGTPQPRLAHEALVSWFSSLLWGGFFKLRYRDIIVAAARNDGGELRRVLCDALGDHWGDRLWTAAAEGRPEDSQPWAANVRRALWLRSLILAPTRTLYGGFSFAAAELLLHLRPPLPWIAILGPDGAGKSTLLQGLQDAWPSSAGKIYTYHLRPHRFDRPGASDDPVTDPHRQPPRGMMASVFAVAFVVIDWWVGYWTHIVRRRAKQGLVVFDRHFLDMSVDPRRYRYGGPRWLLRAASRVVPKPDVIVVLDAPPTVTRSRKQEVSLDESIRQSAAYRHLAAEVPGAHLVDASAVPEQVLKAVLLLLSDAMRANVARNRSAGVFDDE